MAREEDNRHYDSLSGFFFLLLTLGKEFRNLSTASRKQLVTAPMRSLVGGGQGRTVIKDRFVRN